ncbi:DDE superfamily endonuclease [Kutzneria buriramensis]|uniref:DDE superfamily endonuclease n=1 Tax=Kutzneria buriramensis TaxID=1045776 RepID=A0A3E0GV54_9PSEU|nr:DDE superfamily endonuclease [Kutzneria buriramensis]
MSRATDYRYQDEVITVPADQPPDLHDASRKAKDDGMTHLILDGQVFTTDRCGEQTITATGKQIDAWYWGETDEHGGNAQVLSAPTGFPLWVSDVETGSVHDLTAAHKHVLGRLPTGSADAGDGGYTGAGRRTHAGQAALRWPGARCRQLRHFDDLQSLWTQAGLIAEANLRRSPVSGSTRLSLATA